jgi:zinc transport system ATP-binding protein
MSLAVNIENLSVYYGQTPALTNVSLEVEQGEYLGLLGPNGGGKSTLLRTILGLVPVSSGTVRVFGDKPSKSRAHVGYVPQLNSIDRRFPITVFEVVLTGRMKKGISQFFRYSREDREIAEALLEKVGLRELKARRISELSGGQFQKMLIARALAVKPSLLLLDEPTASVDAASRDQIYSLIEELSRTMTIILVTHDLLAVSSKVHRLACLNGSLIYHGEPKLSQRIVSSLYGCEVDLLAHGLTDGGEKKHPGERGKND